MSTCVYVLMYTRTSVPVVAEHPFNRTCRGKRNAEPVHPFNRLDLPLCSDQAPLPRLRTFGSKPGPARSSFAAAEAVMRNTDDGGNCNHDFEAVPLLDDALPAPAPARAPAALPETILACLAMQWKMAAPLVLNLMAVYLIQVGLPLPWVLRRSDSSAWQALHMYRHTWGIAMLSKPTNSCAWSSTHRVLPRSPGLLLVACGLTLFCLLRCAGLAIVNYPVRLASSSLLVG